MTEKKEKNNDTWRNNVTWRIGEHSQAKQLNDWCNAQKNIQDSLTNIVMHMMDRFGTIDIKDYDIQKILYNETITSNNYRTQDVQTYEEIKVEKTRTPTPTVEKIEPTNKGNSLDKQERIDSKNEIKEIENKEEPEEDSFYSNADSSKF